MIEEVFFIKKILWIIFILKIHLLFLSVHHIRPLIGLLKKRRMLNQEKRVSLEKNIKQTRRLISKKKKSIPFIIGIFVLIYLVVFNLRETDLSNYFDNHIDYIIMISSIFIGTVIVYFAYLFHQISKLNKKVKQQNIFLFKLNRLNKDS